MAIFFNCSPASNHLHSLHVENCDSNSRLVVDLFYFYFIETYLYRVDIISSQAIFHMCPVEILLYEKQTFNYIIYNTSELYNTDKNAPGLKHII